MVMRSVVPIVAMVALLSSSPLFAADNSVVEISSTTQQSKPEASCELKVKERYEYYNVDGKTIPELQSQMKNHGTKWGDGNTYAAVTSWNVNYRYDIAEDNGRCSIKSVKTSVDVVYHLPHRIPPSGSDLAGTWDKYMTRLKFHEYGHKDIAVKVAGEVNEVLASMGTFGSRKELEEAAKRLTEEKLQALKNLQVEYDAETHHGETQGAVLASN